MRRKGPHRAVVAVVASFAVALGAVPAANADGGVKVIGPATDLHNKFWGTYDALVGNSAPQSSTQQDTQQRVEKPTKKNADRRVQDTIDAVESKSDRGVEREFRSIADPSQMGDYWSNLNALRIEDHENLTGSDKKKEKYDRDAFPHWELIGTEATRNDWPEGIPASCDARRATLIRDGENIKVEAKGCKIKVGKDGGWTDPYGVPDKDGKLVKRDSNNNVVLKEYKHSNKPSGFDIDHIVALEDVWSTGASKWNDDQRQQIANDPLNLSISDSSANRSKGSKSPASYIPPGAFKCEYVERYVAVKKKYDLSIDNNDLYALNETGKACKL